VSSIKDIPSAWRKDLVPANFDNCYFHVEASSLGGGRRMVTHEFPKRDLPYSEDMGRRASEYSVRGYCIQFVMNSPPSSVAPGLSMLWSRDYRLARNRLQTRLDAGGPGTLWLPTLAPQVVVCPRYRLTEEDRFGGYAAFDMQFVEYGAGMQQPQQSTKAQLIAAANDLAQRIQYVLDHPQA
jgi:prophage DNA circulation protein